jgi:ELWxxDGT repeat protein
MKLGFLTLIMIFLDLSDLLSQSRVDFIPTNLYSTTDFITFKNRLFFTARESGHSWRPYVSDGTASGTTLLKNITISNQFNYYYGFAYWTISGDKMFFMASDSIHGNELWVTDGTENGTRMVKNIAPGDTSTPIVKIHSLSNGKIYFLLSTHRLPSQAQLWVSDGTEAGTYSFFESPTTSITTHVFKNQMYYYMKEGLWITDGTPNGARLLKNLREPNMGVGGGVAGIYNEFVATTQKFFFPTAGSNGYRLWVSDGTTQGTFIPDTTLISVNYLTLLGNKIFFRGATDNNIQGLWVSDGTTSGTKRLKKISGIRNITVLNHKIIFVAVDSLTNYRGLWTSDGTEAGTFMVTNNISIRENNPQILEETIPNGAPFYTLKNKAYFFANRMPFRGEAGELYETDGTTTGTDTLRSFSDHRMFRYYRSNAAVLDGKLYLGLQEELSWSGGIGFYQAGVYVISNQTTTAPGVTDIHIYPTLTTDWLSIESPTYIITGIRFMDLSGRLISSQNVYTQQTDIPTNHLTKGSYLIQIETENGVQTKKFVKM